MLRLPLWLHCCAEKNKVNERSRWKCCALAGFMAESESTVLYVWDDAWQQHVKVIGMSEINLLQGWLSSLLCPTVFVLACTFYTRNDIQTDAGALVSIWYFVWVCDLHVNTRIIAFDFVHIFFSPFSNLCWCRWVFCFPNRIPFHLTSHRIQILLLFETRRRSPISFGSSYANQIIFFFSPISKLCFFFPKQSVVRIPGR